MTRLTKSRCRLMIVRPTLGQGGADRVTLILLHQLDRNRFDISLTLVKAEGEYLPLVPADVPIHVLNSPNVGAAVWPLRKLLATARPDILFSTASGTNLTAVLASRRLKQKPRVVLSERGMLMRGQPAFSKKGLVTGLKRVLYSRADQITAVTEAVKQDLVQTLNCQPDRVAVIYSPVDIAEIQRQMTEPLSHPWFEAQGRPVILAVGRLVPEKDFSTLLRAFARLRAELAARLIILGEGPQRQDLVALAEALDIDEDVQFPGFDLNPFKYMTRCDVFVVSSQSEGICTVLIQAMACGAASVATAFAGVEEIVTAGKDGLLCPVGDESALAAQIKRLLDMPEYRQNLSAQAQKSAARFDAGLIVNRYAEALAQ